MKKYSIFKRIEKCKTEDDFKKFYREYWEIVEDRTCEEKNISIGSDRPLGETFSRVRNNLLFVSEHITPMKKDCMKKFLWFLFV